MWFICSLRPAGSTPCLLPTPPRGDAVGTVFGAEPSKCTDGTFTRVDVRFAGARNYGNRLQSGSARGGEFREDCAVLRSDDAQVMQPGASFPGGFGKDC